MFVQTFIVPNDLNPVTPPGDPSPDRPTTYPASHSLRFTQANSSELAINCQTDQTSADDVWSAAFDLWLSSRRAPNTRRAYRSAWKHFFEFTCVQPWEVTSTEVAGWIQAQHGEGLSAATILQRLAAISSFYTYATRTYTLLGSDGREKPLHHYNPVSAVPRPKVNPYGKAKYLSVDQARAFLRAIPRSYPQGFRDYALFLAYMITGRRNSEIRTLRWGDFEHDMGRSFSELTSQKFTKNSQANVEYPASARIFYRWQGKGKDRRDECPSSLWRAITDFLKAADRLDTISPDQYIFTALNNNSSRLPNVSSSNQYASIGQRRPLTARFVGRLLKRYALRAGLDPRLITVHTLRHTAAMLRKEAGEDVEAISRFLNHSSLSVTQIYLHQVEGATDTGWQKVEALLGL